MTSVVVVIASPAKTSKTTSRLHPVFRRAAAALPNERFPCLVFFITERGKIVPRRISGNCARHQRELAVASKRARHIAFLPFLAVE